MAFFKLFEDGVPLLHKILFASVQTAFYELDAVHRRIDRAIYKHLADCDVPKAFFNPHSRRTWRLKESLFWSSALEKSLKEFLVAFRQLLQNGGPFRFLVHYNRFHKAKSGN